MPESFEDLARGALLEITPAATIGTFVGQTPEPDGSITVRFTSAQPGYPDWLWTVSVADVEGGPATVLEAELLPSDGSLLSPDWVPWSDRLADYKAAQEALEGVTGDDDDDDPDDDESDAPDDESDDEDDDIGDDDDDEDDDDLDDDDLDDHVIDDDDVLGSDVLHGGDLDGVDIDALDEDEDDSDLDDSDEDSEDDGERTY